MALVVNFVLVRLCFGGCRTARYLWQYVQMRAPLWVFRGESLVLARLHGSCRQSLFSSSLVEAGTACLVHGSCRQFCFGPVVLW